MPRNRDFIRIEWEGLDQLAESIERAEQDIDRILLEEYTGYGLLVEQGAKALAPHDEGDLEASIHFDPATATLNGVQVEGGSNAKHALIRHERPYSERTHNKYSNGAKFPDYYQDGRGERTRAKPTWRGYEPGRKYLENAIKATEEDYDRMNERILQRILGEDI